MNERELKVVGVWTLASLRRFRDGTFYRFPMGENATGRLIYSPVGIMAAFLMSSEWRQGTAAPDWSTFMSYSGAWSVDENDQVIHRVDACSISALLGRPLVRRITHRDADTMMLSTEPHTTSSGQRSHDELIWRRASSSSEGVIG